jgi:hypothetical protein
MTLALALAAAATLGAGPPSFTEAGAAVPRVALSVSPARVALTAPASRTIEVRNVGAERVTVDVVRKPIDRRTAANWLTVSPSRLVLGAGSRALLTLRARAHDQGLAGDHRLRTLLIAEPARRGRVAVRIRLGVVVRIRVRGTLIRRTDLAALQVRRQGRTRIFSLSVVNRGNVTEELKNPATVALVHRGHLVARLRARAPRELLPGRRAVISARYDGRVRGWVTAIVTVRFLGGRTPVVHRYEVRL